jgi:O-methyltransferase
VTDFDSAWLEAQNVGTLLGAERGRVLWDAVQETAHIAAAMAELGVYKGGSALLLHRAAPERPLYLFDTFAGHPAGDRSHDDAAAHPAGRFADTDAAAVASLFPGHRVTIVAGPFPPLGSQVWRHLPAWSFVHVDCDLYDSVRAALSTWDQLREGGIMVFDDYGFPDCPGAKRAVDEFFAERQDVSGRALKTGQYLARKIHKAAPRATIPTPLAQGVPMTTHTQWIPITSDGAAPVPGFKCDGCGQVRWGAAPPTEPCELCVSAPAPVSASSSSSTPFDNQGSVIPLTPPPPEGGGPAEPQPATASADQPVSKPGQVESAPPKPASRIPGLSKDAT